MSDLQVIARRGGGRRRGAPRARRRAGDGEDCGQVSVLVAAMVVLSLVVVVVLSRLGATVIGAARSQAAADATVLAALQGGESGARAIAAANGAAVLSLRLETGWAQVTVARDGVVATATAALVEDEGPGPIDP